MNYINAEIAEIEQYENISAVLLNTSSTQISMVSLELNEKLKVATKVIIGAKATNISLAKTPQKGISISNQIEGIVESVESGTILCSVKIRIQGSVIESIITQRSASRMNIKAGDAVIALIKASDISIVSLQNE
ncbi:TOBE domain-containing protein [bacterium]|nr:TOBE domain-containing protein [bacterium]